MKSRPKPRLAKSAVSAGVVQRQRIADAVADLVAFRLDAAPEPRIWGFSESELCEIDLAVERELGIDPVNEKHYLSWMKKTQPVLAHPRMTDDALDLWHMLSQPEIAESFWADWEPRTGARGANPGIAGKALLTIAATLGTSAHFDDNYKWLRDPRITDVFEWIEATSAAATGRAAPNPYKLNSYEQVMKQIRKIVDGVPDAAVRANVEMMKAMHAFYPESCTRAGIDGTASKAWTKQIGNVTPEEERWIRRHAPNAGPRAYSRSNKDGVIMSTFWRGWYLVVLTDLATGLPLVWRLMDANMKEADAISFLLHDLYKLWPECPIEVIVGDNAWDDEALIRECLVDYGIQLVARKSREDRLKVEHNLSSFDSESISKFTGTGVAYCRKHDVELIRAKCEFASRAGLSPGESAPDHKFRLRYKCPQEDGCGGLRHLHMSRHWSALSPLPHRRNVGMEHLHAYRLALLSRRNHCEAVFSALKLGKKLGLESADRTRTPFEPTVDALMSISLMMKTALVLADQRRQRGLHPDVPPPPLNEALGL